MARSLALTIASVALLAAAAFATPTTPVISKGYDAPYYYLSEANGTRSVTEGSVPPGAQYITRAQWNASLDTLGWDYLSVEGEGQYDSGYLEGWLTAERLQTMGIDPQPTGKLLEYVSAHHDYMTKKSLELRDVEVFWAVIGNQLSYIDGMTSGVNAKLNSNYTVLQIFMVSLGPEIGDIETAISVQSGKEKAGFRQNWKPSHCSALVKVTPDNLYVAHDTWDSFVGMAYRIYKVYNFNGGTLTFSSHPGFIVSTDDWYQSSRGLAIQETTNGVMNLDLYKKLTPESVSEFLRVMAANFLADSGEEWTTYFSRENSGTYNNQYMVVDYKRYVPGSSVVEGTLWVAEQLPGIVARGDQSAILAETGYWGSYNIPFYPEIYNLSGYEKDFQEYGNFYSYSKYARPEIFKRNQSMITTLADMMQMMRFNQYQSDPFSRIQNCSGAPNNQCETPQSSMLSIASRGDLMPVYSSAEEMTAHYGPLYNFMAQGCFGAVDSKISAWSERHSLKAWVISGPTNDNQPTFEWGKGACSNNPAPKGTPTVVDYPWVEFQRVPEPGM